MHVEYLFEHLVSEWTGSAGWAGWEVHFVRWAEAAGYELDYAANNDLATVPGLLDGRGLYLSVGHDEYWTWQMRDAVESFVADGGNAVFLSDPLVAGANAAFFSVIDGPAASSTVDTTAVQSGRTVLFVAGDGEDRFTGGASNDHVQIAAKYISSSDSFTLGTGGNWLTITGVDAVDASAFANIKDIDVLQVAEGASIALAGGMFGAAEDVTIASQPLFNGEEVAGDTCSTPGTCCNRSIISATCVRTASAWLNRSPLMAIRTDHAPAGSKPSGTCCNAR